MPISPEAYPNYSGFDAIIKHQGITIHHGPNNKRIYVMAFQEDDTNALFSLIENILAGHSFYEKIIVKTPQHLLPVFTERGYAKEAAIPGFYPNGADCVFTSLFLTQKRAISKATLNIIPAKEGDKEPTPALPKDFSNMELTPKHAGQAAELYKEVFKSYPFPIFNAQYIMQSMADNLRYTGIFYEGKLVALASAEMGHNNYNAEMTDFAIIPVMRGLKLSSFLLAAAERLASKNGAKTLYTICRAGVPPINKVFAAAGYTYGGTLINNTFIHGNMENMNIWYKRN